MDDRALDRAETFTSCFQRAGAKLWCVAIGVLGSRDDAEDCLQEAAMIAWSKWNEFESGTSFGAWMSRIVRFTALNRSRKAATRRAQALAHPPELTTTASSIPPVLAGGALSIDQEAFDDHVVRALHQLQPEARTCLLLKVIADLDYREISTLLEMPEGTAMSHVSRARARMRELLTEAKEPQ